MAFIQPACSHSTHPTQFVQSSSVRTIAAQNSSVFGSRSLCPQQQHPCNHIQNQQHHHEHQHQQQQQQPYHHHHHHHQSQHHHTKTTTTITAAAAAAPFQKKTILVLGGDGFCGWPTSLYLCELGHDVIVVDNLSRRMIDVELACESLTPIQSMDRRIRAWADNADQKAGSIAFEYMDIAKDYHRLVSFLKITAPDAIVHFAEQRAAPYSMKSATEKRYTIDNNVNGTHNVLAAIVESGLDIHLVHLGTMGVYGYNSAGNMIPEGYLDVVIPPHTDPTKILHPANPGSVYHLTKCLDQLMFQFYQKNDNIRITDLHQGIVWGTNTAQTIRHPDLINRFDYDSDYGTVLNRFLMQAALGYPLTVYGTGGQTRAFIHIQDTAKCISIAIANPPAKGAKVEIFNQIAETHRVRDLAKIVADMTGASIKNISNPRNEAAENDLDVDNSKFRSLGYDPITLGTGLLDEVVNVANKYAERCNKDKILPSSFWNAKQKQQWDQSSGTSASQNNPDSNGHMTDDKLLHQLSKGDSKTLERLKSALAQKN